MRGRGITYDTGFLPGGRSSRESFDPDTVREEMRVIAGELHCTAVRITGGHPERLGVAARHAAEAGLEVWFSPFPCELTTGELAPFFAECAERAEELRRDGARVVLVTGCELSVFAAGFLPGETVAVTEFGTCAYTGAGARGGMAWAIVDRGTRPPRLDGDYVRDEGEQVRYLRELLSVFEEEGVDTAFWFTFAGYEFPYHPDPRRDLDMASYGVVRVLEDGRREPKEVFGALAAAYAG
ncbi:hypothetical protein [Microbispora amethystogenes]|uniref:Uncharacterized protein n=1 Tax=Microbispora amethystogenes TaxID=1427754 RepID=A0ABQ4FJ59_9ACTN|nr:hypothetical protein [Microbispora amethystogenes]GIH34862.1 hypothetical protein Mam01_50260 [Microbispora amethystogenes]